MAFLKVAIVLTCMVFVHVDAQTIECHEGDSIDDNELVAPENFKTCDDGIKQCKVSGTTNNTSSFKYGCSDNEQTHPDKCAPKNDKTTCYCTGSKCLPPKPTVNSANNIFGTQVAISFALVVTIMNQIVA